jgi:glycosyltransferase involved in cell wall biosynthesis
MRLLFLTPQLPYPPQQGTALRNWGLISHLAKRHEIWLMSFDERPHSPFGPQAPNPLPEGEGVGAACAQVATFPVPQRSIQDRLRTLALSALPDMAWRLWSPDFDAAFRLWLRNHHFDIVQIEGIELARYLINATAAPLPRKTHFVFDDHNSEYVLQKRTFEMDAHNPKRLHGAAYSFVQWQRLRAFERRALKAADAALCVSDQDAQSLKALESSANPHVIYNGIDVAAYDPTPNPSSLPLRYRDVPPLGEGRRGGVVVFTGKMDFRPNVNAMLWFAEEIWPAVKQAHPATRLLIVGQKPSPRLDPLRADPSITLTGQVDDVRPYIAQADVYIAPLLAGGGTRFKLLEAMAMRRAIVTTTLGCEGFDVTSGREMIVADSGQDFAGAVIEQLRSEPHRRELGERAHTFVSATYDWGAIIPRLEDVYCSLVGPR